MKKLANASRIVTLSLAIVALGALPTLADSLFNAVLTGLLEVPEVITPALGTAILILNEAETEVQYFITFTGLVGTQTAAHFHNAPSGVNGPVVFGLPLGDNIAGTWFVTPAEVVELYANNIYVNVHSTVYPGGEIRGNIRLAGVDNEESSWGEIKNLYR